MLRTKYQAGFTSIGLIFVLIIAALAVYIIIKVTPAYIEAYSVGDVASSLKKEPNWKNKSPEELYSIIKRRLEINGIRSVKQEDVKIEKTPEELAVQIDYEVKIPIFGNVALALSFHKSAVVR